ncbi:hypothetical protein Q3A66_02680 [Hymenobacter sp. BT770]|uniref:hypothetical protein n=1 Tax=Hymenobacter sp. BT770 TaxID=2886942 RepID=UPI001D0FFE8B|nr:hypothetical protein [Hymenobacter sp. BT770]MCC3151464.1 hypothetical protein [Hymenobacter sp. BT770]MDO3413960.1 hypothetical protein [Hymenobacter sp. BT770]
MAPLTLLALLLALSVWLYHDSIGLYPSFNHAWSQADWLAIAIKFRERGYNFFLPATFNLLTDDGVTGAGFPLPAYLAALLMGLTGQEAPGLMRGVTLVAGLGGLLALFALVRRASGSALKGGVVALFAFCSPIYVFYQANFLPSVPAFAAALVGYYWFYLSLEADKQPREARRQLGVAVAWLTMAAAMRTPFALPLLCTLGHVALLRPRHTALVGRGALVVIYATAFALLIADFLYNEYLNQAYHGALFLARPRSFASWAQAVEVTQTVREYWLWSLLSKPQWLLLLLAGGALVGQQGRRLLRNEWVGHWLALSAGGLVYYVLMGQQFAIHDYYLLDTFFLPLVLAFAGSVASIRLPQRRPAQLAIMAALLLLSGTAAWKARAEQLRRITPPATDKSVLTRDNFASSARWLDSLGVPRTATVLVLDAYSYNLPLLLAHRRGWTMLQNRKSAQDLSATNLRAALALPADYVITQNATYAQEVVNRYPGIAAYLQPIANNGRLSLWRIRKVPLVAHWQLRTDMESRLDTIIWLNSASISVGPAASGRQAARLGGSRTTGLAFHQTVAQLGLRAGQQLLFSARYQAGSGAGAVLVASLEPKAGAPPYWQQTVVCRATRPGDWEPLGAAFALPVPHAATDVLKVGIRKSGPGEITLDDWEMSILP